MMDERAHTRPRESDYKAALDVLHDRRRPKRPTEQKKYESKPKGNESSLVTPGLRGAPGIQGMTNWIQQLGYSVADIDRLNVIHVAGTKGKGSTCAWAESFLRARGKRTGFPKKTGMYTSPHLISPEERIRINFTPLSQEKFARYFFEVWDRLLEQNDGNTSALPRYLQLLLLVALHAFTSEGVEAAIIETHHGGVFDPTNVISRPVATVITSLGMDHVEQLGPTIENIAWHKAGIFKRHSQAFSAPQESADAVEVLRSRASDRGVPFRIVSVDESLMLLPEGSDKLRPAVQALNCSVALAAVRYFLGQTAPGDGCEDGGVLTENDIRLAVEGFSWPGRFQLIIEEPHQWYLDSAHNDMSVSKASEWFIGSISGDPCSGLEENPKRFLIFSQLSNHRDAVPVLDSLAVCLKPVHFDKVIFTLCQSSYDRVQQDQVPIKEAEAISSHELLVSFEEAWRKHYPDSDVVLVADMKQALTTARNLSADPSIRTQTLITGSQSLVGGALLALNGGTVT